MSRLRNNTRVGTMTLISMNLPGNLADMQYNKAKKKPHPFRIVGEMSEEMIRDKQLGQVKFRLMQKKGYRKQEVKIVWKKGVVKENPQKR